MANTIVASHRNNISRRKGHFPMGMDAQDVPSGQRFKESVRYMLDPSVGNFGCVVPAGAWYTVEVLEPSVIFEAKDGKYGVDGSESI